MKSISCLALTLLLTTVGCGGDNGGNGKDIAAWLGLEVGKIWDYDVDDTLTGKVEVVKIDQEFVTGVDAYKLEFRVGGFVQVTRWYQVDSEGLFLLGEDAQESGTTVLREYLTRIEMIPYPLEGVLTWNTASELEDGGTETHRFDNLGNKTIVVPAGNFETYHLVQTRTDKDGGNHQYNLYFSPENWLPQFDYPESTVWKLR